MQEWASRFVPVADEVHRLHHGEDAECKLFQGFCEQGHYGGQGAAKTTRQGIYAVTPAGEFLASCNTRRPEQVVGMLRRAWAAWEAKDESRRTASDETLEALRQVQRWDDRFPDDGLALRVNSRDLPGVAARRDWHRVAWNQNDVWFKAEEVRAWLPQSWEVGVTSLVPQPHVARLARTVLIDNVRGQTDFFQRSQVKVATASLTVTAVEGARVTFRFEGETDARVEGDDGHGVTTRLLGDAVFNRSKQQFDAFDVVALGTRWGATRFNERKLQREPTGVGFRLLRLPPNDAERVAPSGVWTYQGW